jgi:two-component system, LytTR family, response regulator
MRLKAIIADDEILAREGLRLLLSADRDVEIVAECANGREAIAALREHRADVLFLDVQMPGINGFEVLEQAGTAPLPVVIFITAYSEYAVKAFAVQALDYLTKPLEPERLRLAIHRVRERLAADAAPITHEQLKSALTALSSAAAGGKYPKRFLVPNGSKDDFVSVNKIEWIEADSYYSRLHVGPKRYVLRVAIKQFAATLDPNTFVRVHRSTIVNINYVSEIIHKGQNEGWVVLLNGQRLKMSKAGRQNLLAISRNPRV